MVAAVTISEFTSDKKRLFYKSFLFLIKPLWKLLVDMVSRVFNIIVISKGKNVDYLVFLIISKNIQD